MITTAIGVLIIVLIAIASAAVTHSKPWARYTAALEQDLTLYPVSHIAGNRHSRYGRLRARFHMLAQKHDIPSHIYAQQIDAIKSRYAA